MRNEERQKEDMEGRKSKADNKLVDAHAITVTRLESFGSLMIWTRRATWLSIPDSRAADAHLQQKYIYLYILLENRIIMIRPPPPCCRCSIIIYKTFTVSYIWSDGPLAATRADSRACPVFIFFFHSTGSCGWTNLYHLYDTFYVEFRLHAIKRSENLVSTYYNIHWPVLGTFVTFC